MNYVSLQAIVYLWSSPVAYKRIVNTGEDPNCGVWREKALRFKEFANTRPTAKLQTFIPRN